MADANLSAFGTEGSTHAQKFSLKLDFKIVGVLVIFFVVLVAVETIMSLSLLFTAAGLILIPAWMFYKSRQYKQKLNATITRLATDNNWSIDQPIPAEAYKAGPAVNLPVGDSCRLAGSLGGLPFWLCADDPDTYLLIDAKKSLPRAIFTSSVYNSGPIRLVFDQFLKAENLAPIKLEGDFDKYFRLYAEPTAVIDALSIIAPDFMVSLIDSGLVSSVMFADRFCFIRAYGGDQKSLKNLIASGQAIAKQLSD